MAGELANVPSMDQIITQSKAVGSGASGFLAWLALGIIGFGLLWWFFHYFFLFKNDITLYRMSAGNSKMAVSHDKYRYRKSKGRLDIQLRDTGGILGIGGMTSSIPPPNVINVTTRGKESCIAIKVSEDELIFPGLNFDATKIIEPKKSDYELDGKFDEEKYNTEYKSWKEYVGKLNFQPLTSTDRAYIIAEIEDRKSRQSKDIWSLLDKYGGSLLLVIVVMIIFVFWKDITAPILAAQGNEAAIAKVQQETAKMQLDTFKAQAAFYSWSTGKPLPPSMMPTETIPAEPPGGTTNGVK